MQADEVQVIWAAVAQLSPKQSVAIRLVYMEGLRPIEAAKKLNCDQTAFHQRLAAGRQRLHQLLNADDEMS
jgi:DNA-directed RNA polymerase specialized sigma24 family protein